MSAPLARPLGLSHLVINVRNMEESHKFWTEVVGFRLVSIRRPTNGETDVLNMRFYVGEGREIPNHHDIALVEAPDLMASAQPSAIHHIAIAFPDRDSWLKRITHLQDTGVKFGRRLEHGMTHSLYIRDPNGHGVELMYDLPREVWEGDVDAALNYLVELPTTGPEALMDTHEGVPVFTKSDSIKEKTGA